MDSCNSGSIQSSGVVDEESVSPFLHPATSLAFTSLHHHRPPRSAANFGPLPGYLDAIARPPPRLPLPPGNFNPILSLDIPWARGLCSSELSDCTDTGSPQVAPPPYTFTPSPTSNIATNSLPSPSSASSYLPRSATPATHPPDPAAEAAGGAIGRALPRGSKKRPRPSRRAPTIVLMTDTSNFRAMVQEFTGGVSPLSLPFSSPAFPRSGQFDRFPAATPPAMAHSPLRPSVHKVPLPSLSNASLSSPPATSAASFTTITSASRTSANTSVERAIAAHAAVVTTPITSNKTATSSSYLLPVPGLPCEHSLGNQHYNLLNLLSFRSLMQPSHEYSSLDVANLVMEKALQGVASPLMAATAEGYAISGVTRPRRASTAVSEGTSLLRGDSSDGGSRDVPRRGGGSGSADRGG